MANNLAIVSRNIRVWRDKTLSPKELSNTLARKARQARDEAIISGAAPNNFRTYVDGRVDVPEESVRPEGAIVYLFSLLGPAAIEVLTFLLLRSPVDSGDFRRAWIVLVNGNRWDRDLNLIPAKSEVTIVNPLPYARKIDLGSMKMSVPPQLIEDARRYLKNRYPNIEHYRVFMRVASNAATIPSHLGPVPYILKGHAYRSGISYNKRIGRFVRIHPRKPTDRADSRAGQEMLYPALQFRGKL